MLAYGFSLQKGLPSSMEPKESLLVNNAASENRSKIVCVGLPDAARRLD
jgi:hypothetical protein